MKKLFLITFTIIALSSCKKEEKMFFESGEVTINGTIVNYSKNDSIPEINLHSYDFLSYEWTENHKTTIDSEGKFTLTIPIRYNQVIFLRYKESANLYVSPNSKIHLSFDAKSTNKKEFLESLQFSNDLAQENTLLTKFFLDNTIDYDQLYNAYTSEASPKEIYNLIDSVYYKEQVRYIDTFIKENNPPESIKNWLITEKSIKPITELLQYALFYFRPTSFETPFEDNFPKDYLEKINKLPLLKKESFINNGIYTSLPNYYGGYMSRVIRAKYKITDPKKLDSIVFNKEIYNFKNNPVLFKILFFDRLNNSLKNNDLSFYSTYKKTIDSTFKNSIYEKAIEEKYTVTKNLVENPELPEKTTLLQFASDDATTFLDEIIKNANGKVIYIDNWATWCAPCKKQFKEATPQLKKEFSDDVEFIYLCHLSDEKLYKPTIAQYKVEGKHYFITLEQNQILTKLLNIKGYPNYNIINKKGELVKSGFEFRPSEPITTKILTQLINE